MTATLLMPIKAASASDAQEEVRLVRIPFAMAAAPSNLREVTIPPLGLAGRIRRPPDARSLVVFAHGSGSSRLSPRNNAVAEAFAGRGLATLLFDLLRLPKKKPTGETCSTLHCSRIGSTARSNGAAGSRTCKPCRLGFSGQAPALRPRSSRLHTSEAALARSSRAANVPDLAVDALERVRAPTLLIVGGADEGVIELNEQAFARLQAPKRLEIVPGAGHLFSEPGTLEAVIDHAVRWFSKHLQPALPGPA